MPVLTNNNNSNPNKNTIDLNNFQNNPISIANNTEQKNATKDNNNSNSNYNNNDCPKLIDLN